MPLTHPSLLRCFSLLVVGLLFPLASSKMTSHCKDKEMACFINTKCLMANLDEAIMSYADDDKQCDVHVEIKPYSTKKALIRLKTTGKSIKLAYSDPSTPIFGCKELDKKIVYSEDPPKELLNSEKWKGGIACEFMYKNDPLFDNTKKIEIQYGNGDTTDKIVTGTTNQIGVLMPDYVKCDMDMLTNGFGSKSDQMIYKDTDRLFSKVDCKHGETLVFDDDNGETKEAGSIQCKCPVPLSSSGTCPGNKWEYKLIEKEASNPFTTSTTPRNVGCRLPGCTNCTSAQLSSCANAAPASCITTEVDKCNVLQCKEKRIRINGALTTIGEPKCEKDEAGQFRWMLNETPVDDAKCVDLVPCEDSDKKTYDNTAKLSCNGTGTININDGRIEQPAQLICDGKNGQWKYGATHVPRDTPVSCVAAAVATTTEGVATGSAFGAFEYAAFGVGGLVVIVAICLVIFCLVIKPKQKKARNNKIKTIGSSTSKQEQDQGLKTAIPVGFQPPTTTATNSDQRMPIKVEVEVVEKTGIASTPDAGSKPKSLMMKTALLPATTATEDPRDEFERVSEALPNARVMKKPQPRSQSDGSEPKSIKIGKNGEAILNKKSRRKSNEKKNDDKSGGSQSEAGTTKKEDRPPKPIDNGPKPQTFKLNEKEEKIRMGATCKANAYPTLADVDSSWEDWDEEKAKAAGNVEAGKKKRKGKTQNTKTVPTAVTPENPDGKRSVERTQATNTRQSVENNNDPEDMGNLVTQLDTTVEQKEVEDKKK